MSKALSGNSVLFLLQKVKNVLKRKKDHSAIQMVFFMRYTFLLADENLFLKAISLKLKMEYPE